jgi:putative cardiolipin synthase
LYTANLAASAWTSIHILGCFLSDLQSIRNNCLIGILFLFALSSCATLTTDTSPPREDHAHAPADTGILAEVAQFVSDSYSPDQSGFSLLDRNADALQWRLALIDSAVSSLDIMYYLWYGDDSGRLLLKRVIRSADRGVRVRLLIDDMLLIGNDKALVALDMHPNIELRLFNPKRQRKAGIVFDFLMRFKDMNSRLHNKLVVADNQAAIIGGRNIGDYYFGLSRRYNFHDLDVLGFGPVAVKSSLLFDNFWNSDWSVPASALPVRVTAEESSKQFDRLMHKLQQSESLASLPMEPRDWTEELNALRPHLHSGHSEVIYDRFGDEGMERAMRDPLGQMLRSATNDIQIINAYIIPDQDFIDGLRQITDRGVTVQILTNSLASHDVPAVNSHYRQWRKPIIEAGAELYEFRADPAIKSQVDTAPMVSKFSGLHTKAFVVDTHMVFIGSMNFDPRSVNINTEMGVTIESEGLGREVLRLAHRDMDPANAWRVRLDEHGDLLWTNRDKTVTRQPARSGWQRVIDWFFRILPKSQL